MSARAGYSVRSRSEKKSVITLEMILSTDEFRTHINSDDKIPNHDGTIEILDSEGGQIGEVRVQVKTLPKKYNINKPSYSLNLKLLNYIVDSPNLPFIIIVVDQENRRAYWKYMTVEIAESLIEEIASKNQLSKSIFFDTDCVISENDSPYVKWQSITDKKRKSILGELHSKRIRIDVDSNKPFLDQLFDFFEVLYSDLAFVPTHLLTNSEPFFYSKKPEIHSYVNLFELVTTNEKLFSFFESIALNGETYSTTVEFSEAVHNAGLKVKKICEYLYQNNIRSIKLKKVHPSKHSYTKAHISLPYYVDKKEICNCTACRLLRGEFDLIDSEYKNLPDSYRELIELSYTNYELGNYELSAKQLLKAKDLVNDTDVELIKYLIIYNLTKLYNLLYFNIETNNICPEVSKSLQRLDIEKHYKNYTDEELYPIINWLHNDRFYFSSRRIIDNTLEKIRLQFKNSLFGSSSYNDYSSTLITEMAKVFQFVHHNKIIFTQYLEFEELANKFTEAIYASLAIKYPEKNSKLINLGVWHFRIIQIYSSPDVIIRLFKTYRLTEIKLNDDDIDKTGHLLIDQIKYYSKRIKYAANSFESINDYYYKQNRKLLWKSLILSAQLNLSVNHLKLILNDVVNMMGYEIGSSDFKYIKYFLAKHRSLLTTNLAKKLLIKAMKNGKLHYQYIIDDIVSIVDAGNSKLEFTDKQFSNLKKFILNKCLYCNKVHSPIYLIYIHRIVSNQKQKNQIRDLLISHELFNVDFEVTYLSLIYGIVEPELKIMNDFKEMVVNNVKESVDNQTLIQTSSNEENRMLNAFVNVCFKFGLELKIGEFFTKSDIPDYYEWLSDMDRFDYDKFDLNWIEKYPTMYYHRTMYHSKQLKSFLSENIKHDSENINQELSNSYMNIFIRKLWSH